MQADWLQNIIDGFAIMSGWEVAAACLGLGYIIFAARESIWCWPMALISTLIYTLLFWDGQLPMQALLNFYYMGMAVYGFMLWRSHNNKDDNLKITSWPWYQDLGFIGIGTVLSMAIAYYLSFSESSQRPYLDAFITVFSVMNTWLMAKKILQNWLYWILIDIASVYLYLQTGYYATVCLFAVYVVLASAGFLRWSKVFRSMNAVNP